MEGRREEVFLLLAPFQARPYLAVSLYPKSPLLSGEPSPYHSLHLGSRSHAFPLFLKAQQY